MEDDEPKSGVLTLRCVTTGEPVHTGVWVDRNDLAALRSRKMHVHCPVCSGGHGFTFSDAWIAKPS
jgi:hypothetical protein